MERATVMKTLQGNLIPKPPNMRDRDASFSSYHQHDANIGSGRCRFVDDSANELSIFDAHKYFNNEVITTNNDIHQQKVTMISTSRVSPVANMDSSGTESNNNVAVVVAEKGVGGGDTTRYSSASSSVDGGYANIRNYSARSFHGGAATPTASSEASWNSQAALLTHHHPKKNAAARGSHDATMPVAVSMRDPQNSNDLNKKLKASLSKPIWILRRKCPCTGRKSVQVKGNNTTTQHKPQQLIPKPPPPPPQHDHETESMIMNPKDDIRLPIIAPNNDWVVESSSSKSQRFHQHRVVASSSVRVQFSDGFTFPVLNPIPSSLNPKVLLRADQNGVASGIGGEDQPPRDSLEVFQPPDHDAVEPTSDPPRPPAANGIGGGEDDVASDASSDLFEIESFSTAGAAAQPTCPVVFRREPSTNGGGNGFFYGGGGRRRSVDEGSTGTECYAPSEVSVEWSVTTAEGYCYEESIGGDGGGDVAAAAEKWRRKVLSSSSSGNGLLSGCRSEKAVSVGPQPVRRCEGQRGATGTSCGGWRHEHEHEHEHVIVSNGGGNSCGSISRAATLGKPPLARPHNTNTSNTPRMSLAFAT